MHVPPAAPAAPQAQDIPLVVVYEDKDLIVIDKPAGLVVHPAAGNPDGTLVNALIAHCGPELSGIGGEARPGIVHRLDKDTSGLLVAAKTERAMKSLAKQFANHTIERAYHAVVWGAPRAGDGTIEGDIGRNPFDRKRMAVLRGGGKAARTRYRVVETFGDAGPALRVAGRMPARDRAYAPDPGASDASRPSADRRPVLWPRAAGAAPQDRGRRQLAFAAATGFPRQALHAWLLGFQHPTLHKTVRFESAWPADFSALVEALRALKKA